MSKRPMRISALVMAIMMPALLLKGPVALANTGDKYSMDINMSGTVVANGSCTFDQGGTLRVDFKEVKLKGSGTNTVELDGSYLMPLISSFSCTGDSKGLLQMKLTSATGSYETYNSTQVLSTGNGIVGIELLVDGVAKNMGEWFTVNEGAQPKLQVQLVQTGTTNDHNLVSGDTFSASATLTLAFN
ncbi:TPA: fimbrial protein [Enterobacter asburiae]